jgi:hypothetical protein
MNVLSIVPTFMRLFQGVNMIAVGWKRRRRLLPSEDFDGRKAIALVQNAVPGPLHPLGVMEYKNSSQKLE